MRKITKESVNAFFNNYNYNKSQTLYQSLAGKFLSTWKFNRLFNKDRNLSINNCGWFSNTTKERLNGLLSYLGNEGIYQKNFVWFLNGEAWNGQNSF